MNSAPTIKNVQRLNEKQACVFNGYIHVFMFYLKNYDYEKVSNHGSSCAVCSICC
jgi:hypothetical protein